MASMVSRLQSAVQQWRELGLLQQNRHTGEPENRGEQGITTENTHTSKRRKKTDKDWEYRTTKGKLLQQTTLLGQNLEKADLEEFGDSITTKEQNTFRVIVQSIQKLSESARAENS